MKALLVAALLAALPALGRAQTPPPPSNNDLVTIVNILGPLANSLVTAISMDNSTNGSMVFTRPPAPNMAMFMKRQFVKDGERQCASFAETNATLAMFGTVKLGSNFTLATWAKLPFAGDNAAVWDGLQSTPLYVQGTQFMCSQKKDEYPLGPYPNTLKGWHHLAVMCDGNTTSLYIDGVINGTAPVAIDCVVRHVGSRTFRKPDVNSQCDLLDDMFMFDRPLTGAELAKLAAVRLPVHEPSAADLALVRGPGIPPAPGAPIPNIPGLNRPGSPTPPAPGAPALPEIPPVPSAPAFSADASDLVKTYRGSLVFVTGEGAGSGFIADLGGKTFLLTNAHVAAGVRGATFKTLDGVPVKIGIPSVAVGHDIFSMQAAPVGVPLEVMRDVGNNASIGDEVVVLGNALGGGVINTIMGHVVGVGPNLVEVDAPFQPGNSGSPIIHLKSKKVIGVATYLTIRKYDPATKEAVKEPVIRRFGYRIDSVKTWQPVNWTAFAAQAAEMESIETLTKDLVTFIKDLAGDARIDPSLHNNPAIKPRIDAWLAAKRNRRMSVKDQAMANENFIAFLKAACQSDIIAAQQHITYDYFQRKLADTQTERAEISRIFGKIIDTVRQER